jgi:hypothetical protein
MACRKQCGSAGCQGAECLARLVGEVRESFGPQGTPLQGRAEGASASLLRARRGMT